MPSRVVQSLLACGALALVAAELATSADAARQHVISTCAGCHCLDFYVTPRSRKAWELTVANMRVYAQHGANPITEADGERVVEYLGAYFGEYSNLDPIQHFGGTPPSVAASAPAPTIEAAPPPLPASAPTPTVEVAPPPLPIPAPTVEAAPPPLPAPAPTPTVEVAPPPLPIPAPTVEAAPPPLPAPAPTLHTPLVREDLPPAIRARLEAHASHPQQPRALKRVAEVGGYVAVACALTLLVSGHNRRRLMRRFRPLHIAAALGLFLGLATHAIIYLHQFGTPPVLWYWFGFASFLVLVLAQLQGLIRKRFGRVFLRVHVAAGYCGLALAVLHWIWAWL